MTRVATRKTAAHPWGLLSGVLMAAFVTLVGVARGLDPLVILQRVLVASVATACVVAAASRALEFLVRKHQKPWHGTRNSR